MTDALRLDHLALRVIDRDDAVKFLTLLGYKPVESFSLALADGSDAESYALRHNHGPDLFVSSGPEGSKMWKWVHNRGGIGAVHHLAFHVDDVARTMKAWEALGVKFQSDDPLVCACARPLTQIFTEPDPSTGLIYELITRNGHPGFCKANVKRLMEGSPE